MLQYLQEVYTLETNSPALLPLIAFSTLILAALPARAVVPT